MQNSSSASGSSKSGILAPPKKKFVRPAVDMQEDLPDCLKDFFSIADVKSRNDAFVLVLHAFMLEVGYIPKDIPEDEKLKLLPQNWRNSGVYRIVYYHVTCPELCCLMTCVPLSQLLSAFGTVDDMSDFQETTFCLQVSHYVKRTMNFSDPSKVFRNLRELSQSFKDNFAYPLLVTMQDALGFGPTFGLPVMMDHIKLQILSSLPVKSVVAMSGVNKELNELCNSSLLWKNLYLRDFDFPFGVVASEEVKQGWKELYKKSYLNRMRHCGRLKFPGLPSMYSSCGFSPHPWDGKLHPLTESRYFEMPTLETGFSEDVLGAFPQLQPRMMYNNSRYPFIPRSPSLNYPGLFMFP